jgi:ribosomal protein S18 acetylase RimI-like enzyme
MPVRIRAFVKSDFEALWQLDQVCFDREMAYSHLELAFYMRRPGAFTLIAESGEVGARHEQERLAGFVVAEARRKRGHIITIDVDPKARRAGVGSALLDAAENQLRKAGVLVVALETAVNNVAAIRFYKQRGYFVDKTMPGYYSGRVDGFEMSKELD